jgi:hypothetical protein
MLEDERINLTTVSREDLHQLTQRLTETIRVITCFFGMQTFIFETERWAIAGGNPTRRVGDPGNLKSKGELLLQMDHAFGWTFNPRTFGECVRIDPRLKDGTVGCCAVENGSVVSFVGRFGSAYPNLVQTSSSNTNSEFCYSCIMFACINQCYC